MTLFPPSLEEDSLLAFGVRPREVRFIFNPNAGHNRRNPRVLQRLRSFMDECSFPARVVMTEGPRHATALAREAVDEGCDRVVAVGGDGTLNEVAAALVGTQTALGLVPCGSGNGLGRHLGIAGAMDRAFATLEDGCIRHIDTGMVNGIPFFNTMGAGFDADLSHDFNQLERRGFFSYARATLCSLRDYDSREYVIEMDGETLTSTAFILSVANSDQYGNCCYIAPGAQVDDGALDLTVIPETSPRSYLGLAARLFSGRIDRKRGVISRRVRSLRIIRPTAGMIHTDGEVHLTDAVLEVKTLPHSLRVIAPRG